MRHLEKARKKLPPTKGMGVKWTWCEEAHQVADWRSFKVLATLSALLVTRPIVSAIVFGVLFLTAAALALVYRLRTFCNYVCPISGFLSLYAMTSTVELRSVDKNECLKCKSKSCIRGSEKGWACPWNVYMGKLDRNNYCGLCFECVKSCPNDNISLFVRPFSDRDVILRGYDEAWKACIMLVLALTYSIVLLGPWGRFKDWANISEVRDWTGFGLFGGGQALLALVIFPGLYYLSIRLSKWYARADGVPTKELFRKYAYMLVPMGLLAWIAFSFPLMMVNGSYIIFRSSPTRWVGAWICSTPRTSPGCPYGPSGCPSFRLPFCWPVSTMGCAACTRWAAKSFPIPPRSIAACFHPRPCCWA